MKNNLPFLHLQREKLLQHVQHEEEFRLPADSHSNSVTSNNKLSFFALSIPAPPTAHEIYFYNFFRLPWDELAISMYLEFESRLTFAVGNSPAASMYE